MLHRLANGGGNDSVRREETDLDLVMGDKAEKKLIVGECKWRNEAATKADIENWMGKDNLLPSYKDRYYVYFSKGGYTEGVQELAKQNARLKLLKVEDLFQMGEKPLFE